MIRVLCSNERLTIGEAFISKFDLRYLTMKTNPTNPVAVEKVFLQNVCYMKRMELEKISENCT